MSVSHQKYDYDELISDVEEMEERYPKYCQTKIIGQSADDRDIYEIILGNPKAKKHMIVIANLHAREYMTTQLCMKQIEYYLKSYNKKIDGKKVKSVLDKVAIHYIPSCNPDGAAISQYGFSKIRDDSLRKALYKMPGSSKYWKANARGVDLNRNWNNYFSKSGNRGDAGFTGYKPESEPEIKAILNEINSIERNGKITGIISYHSTGSIIYGRCSSKVSSSVARDTRKMYKLVQKLTGYALMPVENPKNSAGSSRDYFLLKKKLPFVTIEVGRGSCPLSINEFDSIWKKNKDLVIKEAMLFD